MKKKVVSNVFLIAGIIMAVLSVVLTFVTASKIDIIGGADWQTLLYVFCEKNNGLYYNLCCLGVVWVIVGLILKKTKK